MKRNVLRSALESREKLEPIIHAYIDSYNSTRNKVSLGGYSIQTYRALNQLAPELP